MNYLQSHHDWTLHLIPMITYCYIKKLKLHNFRNYSNFELDSGSGPIVIVGENGIGKTNILEAISLLAKSNGMKKAKASEMQNKSTNEDWAIHYDFFNGLDFNSIGIAKSSNKKLIQIDGKMQQNYSPLYRMSNVIWLIPQMDHILLHSPSDRLKFLDRIASMFEENYACCYMKYRKAKYERNKLLRENILDEYWLSSLENMMAINAVDIARMRLSVLEILQDTINNRLLSKLASERQVLGAHGAEDRSVLNIYEDLSTGVTTQLPTEVEFRKKSNYSTNLFPKASLKLKSQLNRQDTAEYCQNRLKENREKDSLTGRVNFGVHNDNFQVFCQQRSIPITLCSTGEQKLLLLSIILSSVKARCIYHNKAPILLLDDIMSHLDKQHRELLIEEVLSIKCQTWITDVNRDNFNNYKTSFRFFELLDKQVAV